MRNSHYYRKGAADVAQLVEQSIRNRQVTGSIPVVGSIKSRAMNKMPTRPVGIVSPASKPLILSAWLLGSEFGAEPKFPSAKHIA
jgi:hypothetical protein